jgi:hypothetical protein
VAGSCEHDDESSGSIKDAEFLDQLSDISFLKWMGHFRLEIKRFGLVQKCFLSYSRKNAA